MKQVKQVKKKSQKPPDYDSAWKDIIEEHLEPFLEFFFPTIHQDIDFSKRPQILSNELRRIVPSGKVGKRRADVLVKVFLKDGSHWLKSSITKTKRNLGNNWKPPPTLCPWQ